MIVEERKANRGYFRFSERENIFDWDGFLRYYALSLDDVCEITEKTPGYIKENLYKMGYISYWIKTDLEEYCRENYNNKFIKLDKFNHKSIFSSGKHYKFRWRDFLNYYEIKIKDLVFLLDQEYDVLFNRIINLEIIYDKELSILSSFCKNHTYYTPVRSFIF
jgi:hypothetical protein